MPPELGLAKVDDVSGALNSFGPRAFNGESGSERLTFVHGPGLPLGSDQPVLPRLLESALRSKRNPFETVGMAW